MVGCFIDLLILKISSNDYDWLLDKQLYLFAGSYRGLLKCWLLSWNETEPPTFQRLGAVFDEEDQLSVNAIEISCSNHYLIVSAAKSNAIVTASIKFDGNPFERPTDLKYTLLSGLQLSGELLLTTLFSVKFDLDCLFAYSRYQV